MSFVNKFKREINSIIHHFISFYPNSSLGNFIRKFYWQNKLSSIGNYPWLCSGTNITTPKLISIGDNFFLGPHSIISADGSEGIFIGNDVTIARGTYIHGSNHQSENINIPINKQGTECSKITFNENNYSVVIEDDVWIGSNVVILSGSHIAKGCIIGAGSIVTKGFYPPLSKILGNPAKVSGSRGKKNKSEV